MRFVIRIHQAENPSKVSNVSRVITSRLMKRDGVGMIIGVRLFSLFICVVLVFSVLKITTSFDKYKKNNSLPDIYGYLDVPSSNYRTDMIYISYLKGIIELVYIVLQSVVKPGITGFFKIDLHIKCYIYLS